MSDLAYNANGEPFELPQSMAGWRVRKLKSKGAPEVVYGRNGLPLFLPLEADIDDLRREAREAGRYQLDPVDDRRRAILNAEASYICVPSAELTPDPCAASHPAVHLELLSRLINALLESQKQHAELARMYVSQFPVIVDALCSVIRAAGGTGLPQRAALTVPMTAAPPPAGEHGRDVDDNGERGERGEATLVATTEPRDSWPKVLQSLLDHIGPSLGQLVSGLSALSGDSGSRAKELLVKSPEPSLARGAADLAAPRADLSTLVHLYTIAGARDASHGAVASSGPQLGQSRGADVQASEPCAQDRDRTAMPDADQAPGRRREGWQGAMPAPESNGAATHLRARPDTAVPDIARPGGAACDRRVVSPADGAMAAMPPTPDIARPEGAAGDRGVMSPGAMAAMPPASWTAPARVSPLVTSLTAEGSGSGWSASTSAPHGLPGASSGSETSRPNRSTLQAEPGGSRPESFLAQALLAKPAIALTSSDSLVQAHGGGVGDVLAPAEVAARRDRAAVSSPARGDQRADPTPTLPATDGDSGTMRRAPTAETATVGEVAPMTAGPDTSTDSGPANASASRDLSGSARSGAVRNAATAPPLAVHPGAGPPVPEKEAGAASGPDPRNRARGEADADEKLTTSVSAIRHSEPSRVAAPQPVSSAATHVSGPSPPPGSTGQYDAWPQTTQTRDLLQTFIAAFRSLIADRTPVYLLPPTSTSVASCQEN